MITQGELKYEVIGNPPDEYTRIWLRNVNRHFFDAFPSKFTTHEDSRTGQTYFIKKFRRKNTEIWLTCFDLSGRQDGVLETEGVLAIEPVFFAECALCHKVVNLPRSSPLIERCPHCNASPFCFIEAGHDTE